MTEEQKKGGELVKLLKEIYPEPYCALEHGGDPWRLLVMARLSAQCTDARVNEVSVGLFEKYPTAADMASADRYDVEKLIFSCGLYRMKAADVIGASRMICEKFGGEVPRDMDGLLSLPGVGRKIANLILGDAFGVPGIVADTHCIRICGRLGFYPEGKRDPSLTERVMSGVIDPPEQSDLCHRLVQFGRDVCHARSPECGSCPLRPICHHYENTEKNEKRNERNTSAQIR